MNKHIIKYYLKTTTRGMIRTAWGASNAVLLALAFCRFFSLPYEVGYIAVGEFITAVATLVVACLSVYELGIGHFKKARR